jgi:hypothetical protein
MQFKSQLNTSGSGGATFMLGFIDNGIDRRDAVPIQEAVTSVTLGTSWMIKGQQEPDTQSRPALGIRAGSG